MSLRSDITTGVKDAMKSKDKERLSTLRLINAAIKDLDIAARAKGDDDGIADSDIMSLLAKMVKQREESAKTYHDNGRPELAEKERGEIEIIRGFMPAPLSQSELEDAIKGFIAETGASSVKDMGKVMGLLKSQYAGRVDMGKAGGLVKSLLG